MLGLCLVAVFAMSATALVVASPALAGGCNEECKLQKEHEKQEKQHQKEEERRQKLEERTHPWQKYFGTCPPTEHHVNGCIYGEATAESFFQAGNVTVHFVKPVVLRGGLFREEEPYIKHLAPATNGKTIVPVAQPAPSLTEGLDAELLPEKEKQRYEAYLAKGGSTTVTATIELAGPANEIIVDSNSTLNEINESEEKPAFNFPVMIHLSNKFLGEDCYVGTTANPIVTKFYSGETDPPPPNTPIHGTAGKLRTHGEGAVVEVYGARLVNNDYASPGVSGCGVYGNADAALNGGLGLPSPAGSNTTELVGEFQIANDEIVEEGFLGGAHYYELGEG